MTAEAAVYTDTWTATMSGMEVVFPHPVVKASDLLDALMRVAGMKDRIVHVHRRAGPQTTPCFYCPRQNIPNGITGEGGYEFDLRECSDFVLVSLPNPNYLGPDEDFAVLLNQVNMRGVHHRTRRESFLEVMKRRKAKQESRELTVDGIIEMLEEHRGRKVAVSNEADNWSACIKEIRTRRDGSVCIVYWDDEI